MSPFGLPNASIKIKDTERTPFATVNQWRNFAVKSSGLNSFNFLEELQVVIVNEIKISESKISNHIY